MDWIDLAKYKDTRPALVKEKVDPVFEEPSPSSEELSCVELVKLIK
jgi:hypothetical protein